MQVTVLLGWVLAFSSEVTALTDNIAYVVYVYCPLVVRLLKAKTKSKATKKPMACFSHM